MGPKTLEELQRLRAENTSLKQRLEEVEALATRNHRRVVALEAQLAKAVTALEAIVKSNGADYSAWQQAKAFLESLRKEETIEGGDRK